MGPIIVKTSTQQKTSKMKVMFMGFCLVLAVSATMADDGCQKFIDRIKIEYDEAIEKNNALSQDLSNCEDGKERAQFEVQELAEELATVEATAAQVAQVSQKLAEMEKALAKAQADKKAAKAKINKLGGQLAKAQDDQASVQYKLDACEFQLYN